MEQIDEILNCINNAKKRGDNCCLIDGEEYSGELYLNEDNELKIRYRK